jgi:excinuclease ABC subunit C
MEEDIQKSESIGEEDVRETSGRLTKEEKAKREEYLKGIVLNLPESPGVYQYLNEEGTIIYVGKAKNLKRRVSTYFNRNHPIGKTRLLVTKIRDIRYIVVKTEEDALLLENNLIKKYKPRYNILLKDDKTYPSICVSNEYFPRVFVTRRRIPNGSSYYGPYSHLPSMHSVLELIQQLYSIRTCALNLTPEAIKANKFKVCLKYHIKRCLGPCCGLQSHEDYMRDIAEIKDILKGDTRIVSELMMEQMQALAAEMRFEEAQQLKEKYVLIENYRSKSQVVNATIHNVDVFNIDTDEDNAYINYLHIVNGCITQAFTFEYKKRMDETPEEILPLGIVEMRERYKSESREIIVPFEMEVPIKNVDFIVPQRGEKKQLLDLSKMNVKQYKVDRLKQAEKLNPEQKVTRILKEIQEQLHLPKIPAHIECFDNSNISGSDAVAACVVFRMGKPSKKDYRKFNIKTVVGPDDYASMQEVVRRRYTRMMEEGESLPDLLITDGGKGQMEVVRQVVEDELHLQIPIAGLAKNDRHRTSELLYGFPPVIVGVKQTSPLFHLLERIQDEVHRFAITFHRDKRSKSQVASALDSIPGIGPKRKQELLNTFKSVARIKQADTEQLAKVVGPKVAIAIKEALNKDANALESKKNE